jgi:predicted alpha/beta superfamily hydrolase
MTTAGSTIIEKIRHPFVFPHTGEHRSIHVLLPADYYSNLEKSYPVMYMHDAQNLWGFGPFGSWHIDKALARIKHELGFDIIVVGIDHASEYRIAEFMPYKHRDVEKHGGKSYAEFISLEVKRYVDTHYRTLPGREYTGMGGSSMGGLITIYCGIMFSHIYSKLLIFSPSLWAAPKIYYDASKYLTDTPCKLYMYAGGEESKTMVPNVDRFLKALQEQGKRSAHLNCKKVIDPKGRHNEPRWGQEFPEAIKWLYISDK